MESKLTRLTKDAADVHLGTRPCTVVFARRVANSCACSLRIIRVHFRAENAIKALAAELHPRRCLGTHKLHQAEQ